MDKYQKLIVLKHPKDDPKGVSNIVPKQNLKLSRRYDT